MGKQVTGISGEAMALLEAYHWPGNIRELENVIERAVALEQTPVILPDSLSPVVRGPAPTRPDAADRPARRAASSLEAHVQRLERGYIAEALRRADGVQSRAAEILGMSLPVVPLLREEIRDHVVGSWQLAAVD